MAISALLETVLLRIIFVWLSILISTFITLDICMEMWSAFPQKSSLFLALFTGLRFFRLQNHNHYHSNFLPEVVFWQEVKGKSRRSWVGLKVHRSYFYESGPCNRKMRGQKCCSIEKWSRKIYTTYLQLLCRFPFFEMLQSFNPVVALFQELGCRN